MKKWVQIHQELMLVYYRMMTVKQKAFYVKYIYNNSIENFPLTTHYNDI